MSISIPLLSGKAEPLHRLGIIPRNNAFARKVNPPYSSLNQLLNICSLQFYFQRIAKLKPAFASTNLVLGSAYHRTLEQVFLALKNGTVFSVENALEFFTTSWRLTTGTEEIRFGKISAEETEDQGRKPYRGVNAFLLHAMGYGEYMETLRQNLRGTLDLPENGMGVTGTPTGCRRSRPLL